MLYTIFKDNSQKNTKGKTRLMNLLKSGKPLKIFTIQENDLRTFSEQAKNYGIAFHALRNKNETKKDGLVDIIVMDDAAPRVNRIVERFKLTAVDTAKIQTEEIKSIEFVELREIQNAYRITVSKLDTTGARCLDIAHEIMENPLYKPKEKNKTKPGRPHKIETNIMNIRKTKLFSKCWNYFRKNKFNTSCFEKIS